MPIPENPQSRSEQYLNAIATDDKSGLPEFPQSRMEQYLEVIAQNGGGGGGGGGALVVHADENGVLDKTWQEISDAGVALINFERNCGILASIETPSRPGDNYGVTFAMFLFDGSGFDDPLTFATDSANGYPVMQ